MSSGMIGWFSMIYHDNRWTESLWFGFSGIKIWHRNTFRHRRVLKTSFQNWHRSLLWHSRAHKQEEQSKSLSLHEIVTVCGKEILQQQISLVKIWLVSVECDLIWLYYFLDYRCPSPQLDIGCFPLNDWRSSRSSYIWNKKRRSKLKTKTPTERQSCPLSDTIGQSHQRYSTTLQFPLVCVAVMCPTGLITVCTEYCSQNDEFVDSYEI